MQEEVSAQVVYVVRHGARLDYELGKLRYIEHCEGVMVHDPPLSDYGKQQAVDMSDALQRLSDEEKIDKILVSPFLRCLQTAAPLAEKLCVPLSVEEALWEVGQTDLELPPVETRECPHIDIDYVSTFRPNPAEVFPQDCLFRCVHIVKNIIEGRFNKQNLVLVTHAAAVIGIVAAMLQSDVEAVAPAAPAGIFKLTRRQLSEGTWSAWEAVLQSDVSHLGPADDDGSYRGTTPWPDSTKTSAAKFIAAGKDASFWCNQRYQL